MQIVGTVLFGAGFLAPLKKYLSIALVLFCRMENQEKNTL